MSVKDEFLAVRGRLEHDVRLREEVERAGDRLGRVSPRLIGEPLRHPVPRAARQRLHDRVRTLRRKPDDDSQPQEVRPEERHQPVRGLARVEELLEELERPRRVPGARPRRTTPRRCRSRIPSRPPPRRTARSAPRPPRTWRPSRARRRAAGARPRPRPARWRRPGPGSCRSPASPVPSTNAQSRNRPASTSETSSGARRRSALRASPISDTGCPASRIHPFRSGRSPGGSDSRSDLTASRVSAGRSGMFLMTITRRSLTKGIVETIESKSAGESSAASRFSRSN